MAPGFIMDRRSSWHRAFRAAIHHGIRPGYFEQEDSTRNSLVVTIGIRVLGEQLEVRLRDQTSNSYSSANF